MKKSLILIFLVSYTVVNGQFLKLKPVDICFTSKWEVTKQGPFKIKRAAQLDELTYVFHGNVQDVNLDDQVIMKGQYEKDMKTGIWKFWHQNGQLKFEVNFDYDNIKVLSAYDSTGIKISKGRKIFLSNEFKDLEKSENLSWDKSFTSGQEMLKHLLNSSGLLHCDQYPKPPTLQMSKFYQWIASELKYPNEALINGIKGKMYVQFMVNTDGTLTEIKAIKGLGYGCDEEIVRVMGNSAKWIPGEILKINEIVPVQLILPITFDFH